MNVSPREGSPHEVVALHACAELMRCQSAVLGRLSARMNESGLTASQFGVLEALHLLGPLCQRELGDRLQQSGGNITMVVNNLERQGLVVRLRDETDKRYVQVHLTWRGTEKIQELLPDHAAEVFDCFGVLSQSELDQLVGLLRRVGQG